jgi:2-polyprenyl-6-methoxyphenol hydroxylase-like FAD-dependent oxidoreductase
LATSKSNFEGAPIGKGLASGQISRFLSQDTGQSPPDKGSSMSVDMMKDLLVVGAGPVGLMTAVLGARAGLDIELIDQEWRIASRSYACTLHPHSLELLDRIGVLTRAMELGVRVDTVGFYEGNERRAEVDLGALPCRFPFALVLYQDDLEGLIEDALRERHACKVGWGKRLDGLIWNEGSVTAILECLRHRATEGGNERWTEVVDRRSLVEARYIAGADGPRSRLVHLLGTGSDAAGEPLQYGIFEFDPESESGVSEEMRVALDGAAAHVLWPLPGGACRWSLQAAPNDGTTGESVLPAGPHPSLPSKVQRVAPWFHRGIRTMDWATRVEFPQRIVHQFGRGRCWVLGDAAHQTAPGGAQSMNLALREAEEFIEALRAVVRDGAPSGTLRAASERWHGEWRRLLGLDPSIESTPEASAWVREHAGQLASNLPASGEEFQALLGQLGLRWRGLPA